ncbi:MAG: tetratricopeptide repeat protein [Phycisphaerae bacterium]|nr:tetratricopeptide repeat protein [Phycisphaerae bacterium]
MPPTVSTATRIAAGAAIAIIILAAAPICSARPGAPDSEPDTNTRMWATRDAITLDIEHDLTAEHATEEIPQHILQYIDAFIADFAQAPDMAVALCRLGEVYYKAAMANDQPARREASKIAFRKALPLFDKVITHAPVHPVSTPDAYYMSAVAWSRLGDHTKAIEYHQTLVDKWPDHHLAWSSQFWIGSFYQQLKRSKALSREEADTKTEQAFLALFEKYPGNAMMHTARSQLAMLYSQNNQWEKAAGIYELIRREAPPNRKVDQSAYYLAQCYERMGDDEKAVQMYTEFITAWPENPFADSARHAVETITAVKAEGYSEPEALAAMGLAADAPDDAIITLPANPDKCILACLVIRYRKLTAATPNLLAVVNDPDTTILAKFFAADALCEMANTEWTAALKMELGADKYRRLNILSTQVRIAGLLARAGDYSLFRILESTAHSPQQSIRTAVIAELGRLHDARHPTTDKAAAILLTIAADDASTSVRARAIESLEKLTKIKPRIKDKLIQALQANADSTDNALQTRVRQKLQEYGKLSAASDTRWSLLVDNVCAGPVHSAGRGTARVEITDHLGERRHFFNFAFSGAHSRSQRHAIAEDQKPGPPEISWIAGPDNLIVGHGVTIESTPPREFYRMPGYDFHPATFMSAEPDRTWSMRRTLLAWQKNCQTLQVEDCNDLTTVTAHATTEDTISESYFLTLDSKAGLLPITYRMIYERSERPLWNHDVQITYRWKKWQDKYYLSAMERIQHAFHPRTHEPYVGRIIIEILDFVPAPQIDDSEFSLDGLALPDGFPVYDSKTKTTTPYRANK